MKTFTTAAAAVVALSAGSFASTAGAGVINQLDLLEGVTTQNVTFDTVNTTVTTEHGTTKRKTVNGVTGMGVSGGSVNGEIDNCESLTFTFDEAVRVDELVISFLYNDGEFGDQPAEVASIVSNLLAGTLSVTGATTATWTGLGDVENVSVATEAGGGAWRISGDDIFGGAITSLTLSSGNPGWKGKYADFSFVSLSGTPTPTPGATALLGLGGLTLARRRRNA